MNVTYFRTHKHLFLWIFTLVIAVAHPAWSQNPARTDAGEIISLEAGWAENTVAVTTTAPVINPAACPTVQAGYATLPTDPGIQLYHDLLRDAFWINHPVQLLISGVGGDCAFGKPRIISVLIIR